MSGEGQRLKVERFFDCFNRRDFEGMREVVREDAVQEWPQSRERIRGLANWEAIQANYPGLPNVEVQKIHGSEDQWLLSPAYSLLRVTGTGDQYTAELMVHYPNSEVWHAVAIFEFRDGKVAKLTHYFAAPFPPAEWRSQWVERMQEPPPH